LKRSRHNPVRPGGARWDVLATVSDDEGADELVGDDGMVDGGSDGSADSGLVLAGTEMDEWLARWSAPDDDAAGGIGGYSVRSQSSARPQEEGRLRAEGGDGCGETGWNGGPAGSTPFISRSPSGRPETEGETQGKVVGGRFDGSGSGSDFDCDRGRGDRGSQSPSSRGTASALRSSDSSAKDRC
jgi:hypothetical protein